MLVSEIKNTLKTFDDGTKLVEIIRTWNNRIATIKIVDSMPVRSYRDEKTETKGYSFDDKNGSFIRQFESKDDVNRYFGMEVA